MLSVWTHKVLRLNVYLIAPMQLLHYAQKYKNEVVYKDFKMFVAGANDHDLCCMCINQKSILSLGFVY